MAFIRPTSYFLAFVLALPMSAYAENLPYHRVQELDRRKGYDQRTSSNTTKLPIRSGPYQYYDGLPPTSFTALDERDRKEAEELNRAEEEAIKSQDVTPPALTKEDIEDIFDRKMGKPTKTEREAAQEARKAALEEKEANKNFGPVGGLGQVGGTSGEPHIDQTP